MSPVAAKRARPRRSRGAIARYESTKKREHAGALGRRRRRDGGADRALEGGTEAAARGGGVRS
jgi:hypothetical protein